MSRTKLNIYCTSEAVAMNAIYLLSHYAVTDNYLHDWEYSYIGLNTPFEYMDSDVEITIRDHYEADGVRDLSGTYPEEFFWFISTTTSVIYYQELEFTSSEMFSSLKFRYDK